MINWEDPQLFVLARARQGTTPPIELHSAPQHASLWSACLHGMALQRSCKGRMQHCTCVQHHRVAKALGRSLRRLTPATLRFLAMPVSFLLSPLPYFVTRCLYSVNLKISSGFSYQRPCLSASCSAHPGTLGRTWPACPLQSGEPAVQYSGTHDYASSKYDTHH